MSKYLKIKEAFIAGYEAGKFASYSANKSNFYRYTETVFTLAEKPDRSPDFVSQSGSAYWYTSDGVYRCSSHWGSNIASCDWYLDGYERDESYYWEGGKVTGYANWQDFSLKGPIPVYDYEMDKLFPWVMDRYTSMGEISDGICEIDGKTYFVKWDKDLRMWTWVRN